MLIFIGVFAVLVVVLGFFLYIQIYGSNPPSRVAKSNTSTPSLSSTKTIEIQQNVSSEEIFVGTVDEFKDHQPTEIPVGEERLLLIKDGKSFYTMGSKCSHQKYNLKFGVYYNGRIRCPLHGACFSTETGDIEDYPGCNPIPSFPVRVEKDRVLVRVDKSLLKKYEPRPMKKRNPNNNTLFVIIGGGAAGSVACETLRAEGFDGRILVINREKHLPYDRTKLSKTMDTEASKILLRPENFFQDYDIDFKLGVKVEKLDPENKTIELSTEEVIKYDQALIASGADCQRLSFIPGYNASNIHVLRTAEEARTIWKDTEGKNVLIVGSSFIGMEVASCLIDRCKSIIVIGMEKVPFERVLGPDIGLLMQKFHESKGVKFIMEAVVKEFVQKNGEVVHVILRDDKVVPCDLIVLGAGVVPATGFIKESPSIKMERDKSIVVDEYLYTGANGLWAVGDLARYPFSLLDGRLVRIEHWGMAQTQAAIAAKNMVKGRNIRISTKIPYFWTVQYGKNIRYCGHALNFDEILFDQLNDDVKAKEFGFVAYYVFQEKVVAACSLNRDPIVAQVAELMNAGKIITGKELKEAIKIDNNTNQLLQNYFNK